jgi:mannose-6-phosphate isomerase-like protein (cupin superfamily)
MDKADVAEAYYVIAGDGALTLGTEKAQIHSGDVIPVKLNEMRTIANEGTSPLEFLIIGIAKDMATKDAMMAAPPPRTR